MLHLEDFAVGDRFETPAIEVTDDDIVEFARALRPAAVPPDAAPARGSVFGRLVASGWHTAALTMRLWVDHGPEVAGGMVGLGVEELRWGALVPGDRIRAGGRGAGAAPVPQRRPPRRRPHPHPHAEPGDEEVQHFVLSMLVPAREAPAPAADRRTPRG